MRRIWLLAALGCASTAPAKPAAPVNTGDPVPSSPHADARCPDGKPGAIRWLASDPHNPFFVSRSGAVAEAGQPCCAPWARVGSRWAAVGRYGEIAGRAVVSGGEGYDVTQCFELTLDVVEGDAGAGVFASEGWRPPETSAAFEPTRRQRDALDRFIRDAEKLLVPADTGIVGPEQPRGEQRVLFFQVARAPYGGGPDEVDRYAVIGGPFLLIARLEPNDRWIVSNLVVRVGAGAQVAYRPLVAADVDGDGIPELIVHWNAGDSWADVLYRLDVNGWNWEQAAESVGGSTA
jgi:uncharacterized protein (DUF779 family)